ncbi:MAG: DUF4260 domain-containing protein [Pseudomonadota bacterium]
MSELRHWSLWLRLENLVVLLTAAVVYHHGEYNWWLFAVVFLVPDLSILGYLAGRGVGATVYNLAHAYIGPAALLAFALISGDQRLTPFAIIWVAHIAADRLLGFGLKSVSGFRHTHLGFVGKEPSVQE